MGPRGVVVSAASDPIPRSTLRIEQQRRVGALQAAKRILLGQPDYQTGNNIIEDPTHLLEVARWIDQGGST